jgi:iron-regulated transporter 1
MNSSVLYKLYLSHTLSTWNARTFEFSAVIFLASVFPSTLFYASSYALFRSLAAFLFSSKVGQLVDTRERLWVVRQSIVWQRISVACSCLILVILLRLRASANVGVDGKDVRGVSMQMLVWFGVCVVLACVEKLAFVGNTVAVERDWAVVVANSLHVPREELNSAMRQIDLVCKLVAPVVISLVEGWWTEGAVWVVFGQNALSVIFVRVYLGWGCWEGMETDERAGVLCHCAGVRGGT